MKKVIMGILLFLIINIISITSVLAEVKIDAQLTSTTLEIKAGEVAEITFTFNNFEGIKKGINAYKGTLEYDKNIFEEIIQSDFICQNNWEGLKYNPQNGQFIAFRKVGTKLEENVITFRLKAKTDIEATKTMVTIKDITTSEGKKDILVNDVNIMLNIVKDQQTIPTKPTIPAEPTQPTTPNNPSQGNTITNNTKPSDVLAGNTINTDINQNPNDIKDAIDSENNQNEKPNKTDKPTTAPEKTPTESNEPIIKKTTFKYSILLPLT